MTVLQTETETDSLKKFQNWNITAARCADCWAIMTSSLRTLSAHFQLCWHKCSKSPHNSMNFHHFILCSHFVFKLLKKWVLLANDCRPTWILKWQRRLVQIPSNFVANEFGTNFNKGTVPFHSKVRWRRWGVTHFRWKQNIRLGYLCGSIQEERVYGALFD